MDEYIEKHLVDKNLIIFNKKKSQTKRFATFIFQ